MNEANWARAGQIARRETGVVSGPTRVRWVLPTCAIGNYFIYARFAEVVLRKVGTFLKVALFAENRNARAPTQSSGPGLRSDNASATRLYATGRGRARQFACAVAPAADPHFGQYSTLANRALSTRQPPETERLALGKSRSLALEAALSLFVSP